MNQKLFYIDGHNVGYWKGNGRIDQDVILTLLVELKKRGDNFVCFFDANIHKHLKDQGDENFIRLLFDDDKTKGGFKFRISPPRNQADGYIIRCAIKDEAYIISNDQYRDSPIIFPNPERHFGGMANWSTRERNYQLMMTDLNIEVPVETDIPKLLFELGISNKKYPSSQPKTKYKEKTSESRPHEPINIKIKDPDPKPSVITEPVKKDTLIPPPTPSKSKTDYTWYIIAIFLFSIIVIYFSFSPNYKTNTQSESATYQEQPSSQDPPETATERGTTKDCETNNSGYVYFRNTTSQTVYGIILQMYTVVDRFEIPPKKQYKYTLTAHSGDEYSYICSYFQSEDITRGNIKGDFGILQCQSTIIDLILPDVKRYRLQRNVWTEVLFPNGGDYTIFVTSGEFYYKYDGDDKIYSGFGYYTQRVHEGDRVYFATPKAEGEELGIVKAEAGSNGQVAEIPRFESQEPKDKELPIPIGSLDEQREEVQVSTYARLEGTIGQMQVNCTLIINPDNTVQCECNSGTNYDPPIHFEGKVARNGNIRLAHIVNGQIADYVPIKVKNGCYSGKSIGANGFYFIQLCPSAR